MTSSDVGLRIRCNYNLTNRTVTHTSSLEVNDGQGGGNGLGEAAMQTTAVAALDALGAAAFCFPKGDHVAVSMINFLPDDEPRRSTSGQEDTSEYGA